MTFAKITKMCQKHGFLKQAILHNQDILKIGPIGASLQENLRNEWLLHMTTNRDLTTFLNPSSFSETFDYAKYLCSEKLPFAITEIVEGKSSEVEQQTNQSFSATLKDENRLLLRCTTFVGPSSSVPYFHQWQRQRKAWWRKFSASPGRYAVTDIQSNEEGDQRVEIQAKYEWGTELLETINLFVGEHENLTLEQLQMKDGRKKVQGHHIVNTSCLSKMLLNTLCDAYEEPPFQNEKRPLLKFHRKLAPFKIAFAISSSSKSSKISQNSSEIDLFQPPPQRNT